MTSACLWGKSGASTGLAKVAKLVSATVHARLCKDQMLIELSSAKSQIVGVPRCIQCTACNDNYKKVHYSIHIAPRTTHCCGPLTTSDILRKLTWTALAKSLLARRTEHAEGMVRVPCSCPACPATRLSPHKATCIRSAAAQLPSRTSSALCCSASLATSRYSRITRNSFNAARTGSM